MSKGLKALERITNYKCRSMSEKIQCKEIIKKELKALEIIKEKRVLTYLIENGMSLDEYNSHCDEIVLALTQEEYDLVKKVLL